MGKNYTELFLPNSNVTRGGYETEDTMTLRMGPGNSRNTFEDYGFFSGV